jgi:hypothetical protein
MSIQNRKIGKKRTDKDGSLLVRKKDVPAGLHDKIERFVAQKRIDGFKLTKPQAAVELITIGLTSRGIDAK